MRQRSVFRLLILVISSQSGDCSHRVLVILLGVFGNQLVGDTTTRVEPPNHFHLPRLADGNQVIENLVRHTFEEDANAAVGLEVELQRAEFHAPGTRHVADDNRRKIGLSRLWTKRRKLRARKLDRVGPI